MSRQLDAAEAYASLLKHHPFLDGKVSSTVYTTGSWHLTVAHRRIATTERNAIYKRLVDIVRGHSRVVLESAPGRGAWRTAAGHYDGAEVEVSVHYDDDEAEALHQSAESCACDASLV